MDARPILMVTAGTAGDVLPFLALARALGRRGHPVTLLTSADHRQLARAHGVATEAVAGPEWPQDGRNDGRFWRAVTVPGYRVTARRMEAAFRSPAPPVVVARDGNWAVRFCAEKFGVPFVRIVLQPSALVEEARAVPTPVAAVLNGLRADMGLPARPRFFDNDDHWQPTISFFPDWFGGEAAALRQAGLCAGFPFADPAGTALPDRVRAFVQEAGRAAVFSAGTGIADPGPLGRAAAGYCAATGMPTLFLHPAAAQPAGGPDRFLAHAPVPHGLLLPHCRLVVHQGGIGTVAQALRAAVAQVLVPVRYDQPDNARRVEGLGVGTVLRADDLSGPAVARAAAALFSTPALDGRLRRVARLVGDAPDAIGQAAGRIGALAGTAAFGGGASAPVRHGAMAG